jgi:hypothetical protein
MENPLMEKSVTKKWVVQRSGDSPRCLSVHNANHKRSGRMVLERLLLETSSVTCADNAATVFLNHPLLTLHMKM